MPKTTFIWDQLNDSYLAELDDLGAKIALYTQEPSTYGGLISQRRHSDKRYIHSDGLGSTRALSDESQLITSAYVYNAWAEESHTGIDNETSLRWIGRTGYYRDEEIATYYVRRRTYAASLCRWTSKDPIHVHTSLVWYSYTMNRPLSFTDASGLDPVFDPFSSPDHPTHPGPPGNTSVPVVPLICGARCGKGAENIAATILVDPIQYANPDGTHSNASMNAIGAAASFHVISNSPTKCCCDASNWQWIQAVDTNWVIDQYDQFGIFVAKGHNPTIDVVPNKPPNQGGIPYYKSQGYTFTPTQLRNWPPRTIYNDEAINSFYDIAQRASLYYDVTPPKGTDDVPAGIESIYWYAEACLVCTASGKNPFEAGGPDMILACVKWGFTRAIHADGAKRTGLGGAQPIQAVCLDGPSNQFKSTLKKDFPTYVYTLPDL